MTMELGGKSANIVLEDADIDIAVDGAMTGIFYHSGQICIAGSRLLVARSIYDEFVKRLKKRVGDIGIGYQMMPETQMGPVASAKQLDKIKQYVAIGKKEGAKLLCGGERARLPGFEGGYYFKPTIFVNVENKMRIAQEEIFGPVLCVIPFKDDDEAVRIANDTAYGLAGAVWSRDIGRAEKLAVRIKTGTMWINDYSNMADFTPFGGYKQSGVGREFGHEGLAEYTEAKRIYVSPEGNPDRPNFQSILRYPRSGTFTFNGSTKINAGPGSVASASTEIFNLGCRRAVVITDKGIRNAGVLDIVAKAMGDYCVGVFDGVEPDTGYEIIDGAVAVCKEARADCLVALGGGSSIDTAKGAAVTLTNGGRAIDNISVFRLVKPVVPIIAIPTTHGTGSEVTNIAVVLNRDLKKKFFIVEQAITPRTAILDGALVVGLPKSVSIGTGMDALTHSLESAICRVNNSITSAFALQSIRLVARYLPMVADNGKDVEARQQMLNAATMGGWACFAGAGVAHSIAHTVGSLCHVHHGTACGIALPHAMRFNRDFCLPELGLVAEALGVKTGGKSQTQ
ncbi:MAG: aldehyde dehydrogenase family protein, partial [Chloroflexi bacterium]|nr:aldehyde dehydrogenase family protein [Chloroflexota bacterium]